MSDYDNEICDHTKGQDVEYHTFNRQAMYEELTKQRDELKIEKYMSAAEEIYTSLSLRDLHQDKRRIIAKIARSLSDFFPQGK